MNFSVLMSVYYREKPTALKRSMESIFSNTVLPSECVVVKDGPLTKELDSVIDEYKNKYPNIMKIVVNEKNLGLGKALAVGLSKCSNEIVARMDSDDICATNRFEKQLNIMAIKPKIAIVGSNIAEYDEKMSVKTGTRTVPQASQDIRKYAKKRNPFNHMTVMFRKTAVLGAGSYKDMPYFEDYYLWTRLLCKNQGYNIQEELVKVRAGAGMIERRGGRKYIKSIINFEKTIHREGFISLLTMISNICIRSFVAIIPSGARSSVYKKYMRKKD